MSTAPDVSRQAYLAARRLDAVLFRVQVRQELSA